MSDMSRQLSTAILLRQRLYLLNKLSHAVFDTTCLSTISPAIAVSRVTYALPIRHSQLSQSDVDRLRNVSKDTRVATHRQFNT